MLSNCLFALRLLIQPPDNMPGKGAEDSSSAWVSATHTGDVDGVPGSWRQPGPVMAITAIWESESVDGR